MLPWLATGGAVYCFKCTQVNVTGVRFENNSASYGGGAALPLPNEPSHISSSVFQHNKALPNNERARELQAKAADGSETVGWLQAQQDQQLRLGSSSVNPLLADTGYYSGGGGLYISTATWFNITGCGFWQNNASSGGKRTHCAWNICLLLLQPIASLF